ncbi:MAG: OmpH family outer membrane protein [Bacteroidales bacterium]|jgi:outer membrane protein|nr:OmpH family outer membrane protein [Bacteroidales bacterium]MDD3160838.1 OmpH family outer membrane protein [Bacteroidales bacterium]
MKNVHFIIEGILAAAVIALFILQFSGKQVPGVSVTKSNDSLQTTVGALPIAYINVDSLLLHYNFSKEMNEQLLRKRESSMATLNQKGKELEGELGEFQRKLQNNAFLSQDRAQSEENRLRKKQSELQELEQRLSAEITQEQSSMNEMLRDSVYSFLKTYNKENPYQIILSNTFNDNILYSAEKYDITKEVIEQLNARYMKKK